MKLFKEFTQIFIGIILASIGLKAFLLPNGFLDGGVTGIAILLSEVFDLNVSILLIIVSIPFFVLANYTLTRRILLKSILSVIGLALIIELENFEAVTDDKLLISIFGGLFLGSGIGLTIKNGAVLDGSEILGIFANNRLGISIGQAVLFFNIILFSITAILLSLETAMYSILAFLVTAKVIDLMIEGFEDYVGLMIVSAHSDEIQLKLIQEVGTGLTLYKGATGYGKGGLRGEGDIIHTAINRIDIRRTFALIDIIDPKAFIIEFDINSIRGGVANKYLTKEGIKKLANPNSSTKN